MSSDPARPDLGPSAERLAGLLTAVHETRFADPTPCEGRTVGQLIAHLVGLTAAFRASAQKDLGPLTDTDPDQDGWPEAGDDWRHDLEDRLVGLVTAWREPEAWEGTTRAGGVELPAAQTGVVALNELTLHGWDLARATGQPFVPDAATTQVLQGFVEQFDEGGTPGMFGPAVRTGDDAEPFDRVLARSGRDPRWEPAPG